MSETATLLVEIGTEELPPKALTKLATVFRRETERGLASAALEHGPSEGFATPRRLALKIADIPLKQPDQHVERRGPAVDAAFDANGNPTKAALGFAASCGVDVTALSRQVTDKGEWLSYAAEIAGESTLNLLPAIVGNALDALPVPKPMRWGASEVAFVRPVHWVVMMLGESVIDATILGIASGARTRGHRFHAPGEMTLRTADDYPRILREDGYVVANFAERREMIVEGATALASSFGARAIIDPALLDEVTALVEWPVAISGTFDGEFLDLPREVLIATMQDHQKYFPVESTDGVLTNRFITISNIDSRDPAAVRSGNERVIRPRLGDAAFFWSQDRKSRLEHRSDRLDDIIFEKRLGSIGDKSNRVVHLARLLAAHFSADVEACARAAHLSRCDLVSEMVGEFPELQGVMGSYYAENDGEAAEVVTALREFYQPRFAGDAIPATATGRCIAFADKLDTLVGIFAIGAAPTGDKDPFALRRAALGCIRIALEGESTISLAEALGYACDGYANVIDTNGVSPAVTKFILDRMRGYFAEQKLSAPVVEAVLAIRPDNLADIRRRIDAVETFRALPESAELAAANKRISNILRKSGNKGAAQIRSEFLRDPAEIALHKALEATEQASAPSFQNADYAAYLRELSQLNGPINRFFDDVMVMSDDEDLRGNRIRLLQVIHDAFTRVADIARLNE